MRSISVSNIYSRHFLEVSSGSFVDSVRLVLSFEESAGFMWTQVKMAAERRFNEGRIRRLEPEVMMYLVDWSQMVEVCEF